MRSLDNTLWDVLVELELADILQTRVDCVEPNKKWMVRIRHPDRENSLILVEVFVLSDNSIVTSLMDRRGFSRRVTEAILDGLVQNMDTDYEEDDDQSISSQSLEQ
jgi:hypothetical protein